MDFKISRKASSEAKGIRSTVFHISVMLAILAAAILFSELLLLFNVSHTSLIMLYLLSVAIISYILPNYAYGITAALVSTLVYDYLITAPRMDFSISTGMPITLFTMLVVTFIISTLTSQTKTQAMLAIEREQRAELLRKINQKLLAARDVHTIVRLTNEYILEHLKCPVAFYTGSPERASSETRFDFPGGKDSGVFDSAIHRQQVRDIFKNEAPREYETESGVICLPVESRGKVLGVIGIAVKWGTLSMSSRTYVQMLMTQVTLALDLQILSDERSHMLVEAEKEKTRSILLRSISHDLRTPLTSILGASSIIAEQDDIDRHIIKNLAGGIQDDVGWLIRMVENILIITRISSDNLKVTKTTEAAEEVVSQAADIVRKRFPDCFIYVHIPDEILMVPMDATLISQVLINLLENAVKNSADNALILLDLERKGDFAQFTISDNGRGIPEEILGNLFEAKPTNLVESIDASRGMGIGLSICKTMVEAHGGFIEGYNRDSGGASFVFRLPLEDGGKK